MPQSATETKPTTTAGRARSEAEWRYALMSQNDEAQKYRRQGFVSGAEWQASRDDTTPLVAEIGSLTAQLQAAHATLAEVEVLVDADTTGALGDVGDILSHFDPSTAVRAASIEQTGNVPSRIESLLEQSSLGTAEAQALRASVSDERAAEILRMAGVIPAEAHS